ncbi:fimbria/pilus outer membrane usher protein [Acinetobacter sp. GSS19]|uniref:fimbria/pilus outer membrane usher protein n=1 Tax=Acinetobacter sp. GSS19 TaxID=3020716 RepID=UPI002360F9BD|nr:fimbria/pilus outer membrane usher protein [Acinetobacter sp. GSS19]
MGKIKIPLLLYCILYAQVTSAVEQSLENPPVLSTIWLNGVDQQTEILFFKENEQEYLECSVLEKLNLNITLLKHHSKNNMFCLVTQDQLKVEFDASLQAVKLDVPAHYFNRGSSNEILYSKPEKSDLGAFLNYDFFYLNDEGGNELNTLSELGIFKDNWIFKNTFIYRKKDDSENENDSGKAFARLNTSLDFDFSDSLTSLTIGDTTTISNALINSFRFGGISWGSNYTNRPDFIYWNVPSLEGSAVVPSTVDLYLNGVSIFKQTVSPGDYNLQVGANIQNAGEAQLVVEDVLGNRTVQSFPILISSRLLKPGLNEYNLSLGKIRYDYSSGENDYREFFTSLYFRRGISSKTTLGANASYSKDLQSLGLLWTQAVSKYFTADVVGVISHTDDQQGYSAGLSLNKNFGRFNFGLSSRYTSDDYKVLGYDDGFVMPKWENLLYFGLTDLPIFQNFNMNYVEQRQHQDQNSRGVDRKVLRAEFSRQITADLSMRAGYFKEFDEQADSGAFLFLTYNFGKNRTLYADYSTEGDASLTYAQSNYGQLGLDYAVGVQRRSDREMIYNVDGQIKTRVGDLTLQHVQSDQSHQTQAGYRGAMVWLDGQFNFTQPVDNAFALVRVGDYSDIDVYRTLALAGKTNKRGYVFVHDIPAYVNYDISFDIDQLPMDDKVPFSSKKISALDKRGYVVNFPVYHAQKAVIRLLDINQHRFVAGSEVHLDNPEKDIYPVGTDGLVTLYGLLPGEHKLTVYTTGGASCQSKLIVAEKTSVEQQNKTIDLVCK